MKNKTGIIIAIVSIFLIGILGLKYNLIGNIAKLKADISYPTSNGVKMVCDKSSLKVNETTTCTVTGYLTGGARGVTAAIDVTSGLQIQSVTPYNGMTKTAGGTNDFVISTSDAEVTSSNQFGVVIVSVKALSTGSNTVSIIGNEEPTPMLTDTSYNSVPVSNSSFTINVTSDSQTPTTTLSSDTSLKNVYVDYLDSYVGTSNTKTINNISNNMSLTFTEHLYSIYIRVEPNDLKTTITGDVAKNIDIETGTRTFNIIATAEDNTVKEYKLTIVNPEETKSSDATLKSLSVSSVTLVPTFNSNIHNYDAVVPNNVESVTVSATANDSKATVNSLGNHELSVGKNEINVCVTAENNSHSCYIINITREDVLDTSKSSDNTLEYITINGKKYTNLDNIKYETQNEDKIEVNAKTKDSKATINYFTADGTSNTATLKDGSNSFNLYVTAENGSKKIYSFIVSRISKTVSCDLKLKSNVYKIDNDKATIAVSKDHNDETIKKNLSSDCGEITVSNEKVTLSTANNVKVYTINRVWQAQTGQKVIKYAGIIFGIVLIIGALIYIKSKISKD